jgi:hypothetical protein
VYDKKKKRNTRVLEKVRNEKEVGTKKERRGRGKDNDKLKSFP